MDTSNVSSTSDYPALSHSTAVFIGTLWSFFFFFWFLYLSFIVFFIRPLSGGDKRKESGESRDGVEGGGVNAHIAPTSSFEVVSLYFLFMRAIGDIKVGQLLNPCVRVYTMACLSSSPGYRWLINSKLVNSEVLWQKCVLFIRMLSILK